MSQTKVLEMRDITKQYFGNTVLNGVSIDLQPGEIHALVGENGAGKSTLMNILFGMPVIHSTGGFSGDILVGGQKVDILSPRAAMDLGIGMVHQEFMLLPGFTVTENIKLNREITRRNLVSRALRAPSLDYLDVPAMRKDARAALRHLDLDIDEWVQVAGLPVGYMQFIEIAREIDKKNVRILVFDEPTAVLTETEAERLLDALRRLASEGIAILFITHRLAEVMAVANRITVLRDGEVVARLHRNEAVLERIAELMVGRKVEKIDLPPRRKEPSDQDIALTIENLVVNMPGEVVRGVSLAVRRGEILGIGGLAGHGKIGIANGIMGLYPASGRVSKNGREVPLNSPDRALAMGLAFVSEDRRGVGLLLDESIERNIATVAMQVQNKFLARWPRLPALRLENRAALRSHAEEVIRKLDIRCTGPGQLVRRLSGGNQQKVCIAKALTLDPEILLVSEPTRGIDVGAKKLVLDLLVRLNRERNVTIVMTSSELGELRKICDRIAIVYGGKLAGILPPDASDAEFGLMMAGGAGIRKEAV
ncbi:MAG: simple sugar transport system ATP-binding protein [Bacillota bacterium]|nr:simple sugar transport system ATP-binding protein [Bacillota bacterium]